MTTLHEMARKSSGKQGAERREHRRHDLEQQSLPIDRWDGARRVGKAFGQIVTTQVLEAHQSWRFDGDLPLVTGGVGVHHYIARIYLTADLKPGAQSPVTISVAA